MATEKKRPLTSEIMSERSFPVIKVTVIKVIKDFGFSKYPPISLYHIK